ncbi:hypothetical protein ACTFIR_009456 [Dictyostelium discoideum]
MEFLDTSDPSKSKGKLPTCKEYSCPGIYIFFTGQLVGFPKDSGQAFPFVIDYIGKASSNLYSRFGNHCNYYTSIGYSLIQCYIGHLSCMHAEITEGNWHGTFGLYNPYSPCKKCYTAMAYEK